MSDGRTRQPACSRRIAGESKNDNIHAVRIALAAAAFSAAAPALAQPAPSDQPANCLPQGFFAGPASYKSVEQFPDGRVAFRICAPEAREVRVTSNDIDQAIPMGIQPGSTRGLAMTKDAAGLWSATTAVPVPADVYRFNFQVDGARVPRPAGHGLQPGNASAPTPPSRPWAPEGALPDLAAGRAARRGLEDRILVERAPAEAHRHGLHAAGLHGRERALSGALPGPRGRRQLRQLDLGRSRQPDPRQPHRPRARPGR